MFRVYVYDLLCFLCHVSTSNDRSNCGSYRFERNRCAQAEVKPSGTRRAFRDDRACHGVFGGRRRIGSGKVNGIHVELYTDELASLHTLGIWSYN